MSPHCPYPPKNNNNNKNKNKTHTHTKQQQTNKQTNKQTTTTTTKNQQQTKQQQQTLIVNCFTQGAYAGLLSSLAVMFWVGIGSHIAQVPPKLSPRSTGGCNWTLVNGLQHTAGAVGSNWTTGVSTIDLTKFSTASSSLMNATLAPGTESNS